MLIYKSIAYANSQFANNNYNPLMDIKQIRRQRLKEIVDKYGGPGGFAKLRSKPDADKPIDSSYVSQVLNGTRNLGETAARNMEERAGLPEGYLDRSEEKKKTKTNDEDLSTYDVLGIKPQELTIEQIDLLRTVLKIPLEDIPHAKKVAETYVDPKTGGKGPRKTGSKNK